MFAFKSLVFFLLCLSNSPAIALQPMHKRPHPPPSASSSMNFQKGSVIDSEIRHVVTPAGSLRPVLELASPNTSTNEKPRVLFFHGEYTNEVIAKYALKLTRWNKYFDFVIPGAPYEGCVVPQELFESLGLEALEKAGQYSADQDFWKWGSRYEFMKNQPSDIPNEMKERYQNEIAKYVKQLDQDFGPFDGVMGFCEGGAALNCALGMKEDGKLNGGLDTVKFFIHLAPWCTPLAGEYHQFQKTIPTLSVYGTNDEIDGFQDAYQKYSSGFKGYFSELAHDGKHSYPPVTPTLLEEITKLSKIADEKHHIGNYETAKESDIAELDDSLDELNAQIIKAIAAAHDEVDADDISMQSSLVEDLEFDSLHFLELVQELEKEFGIGIDIKYEQRLTNEVETVQDVVNIVREMPMH